MDTAYYEGETFDAADGYYDQFIPTQVKDRNAGLDGLQTLWMKIGDAYRTKKNPTPQVILKMLDGSYKPKASKYLRSGGTVEDALEAICKMAKDAIGDGQFHEMYGNEDDNDDY